jgi:hypothetical protein
MKTDMCRLFAVTVFALSGYATSQAKTIDMVSAIYGSLEAGKTCNATPYVASICNGRRQCDVDVGNGSLCGDPDFLSVKKVVIDFRCGRSARRIVEGEYHTARVTCD